MAYALKNQKTGEVISCWPDIPIRVDIPVAQIVIFDPAEGWAFGDFAIVASEMPTPPESPELPTGSIRDATR